MSLTRKWVEKMNKCKKDHGCCFPHGELRELSLAAWQVKQIMKSIESGSEIYGAVERVGSQVVFFRWHLLSMLACIERALPPGLHEEIEMDTFYKDMMKPNKELGWGLVHEPKDFDEYYKKLYGDLKSECGALTEVDGRFNWWGEEFNKKIGYP